jgi:small conductance mechanosensitive channel
LFLVAALFVAQTLARLASTPVRRRVDETIGRFVGKLVYYAIMVCALLGVLQAMGVSVASFAAVIAAAGFAVGLAFQGTLSNFASGILMLVFRPFKVGDTINAAGITATVHEIGLFTTIFDTPDNRRIIVPNNSIASGTIENVSHHRERRVDVAIGVAYPADVDQTREVLTAAAESLREFLIDGEGRGFQIVLTDLGDSSVNWAVRFWTKADDFWTAKEALTAAVKNHLDAAGIGIPYPTMDVNVQQRG